MDLQEPQLKQQQNDLQFEDLRDVQAIRILRPRGFFGVVPPIVTVLRGTAAATTANYTAPFFIADRSYQVLAFMIRFETASSDAGRTLQLLKVPNGTAPASGTNLLTAGVAMTGTANTNTSGTVVSTPGVAILTAGDSLSLNPSGTPTNCVGLTAYTLLKAI